MSEVKITEVNGAKCFEYRGIEVDRETWESASCPMCCEKITDNDCCEIARTLYNVLVSVFGIVEVTAYIKSDEKGSDRFNDIDDFRWREEENLFLDFGGQYYEDMETGENSRYN